jgi:peptidoglycan/LPS O-acetylase OafA/YrhL
VALALQAAGLHTLADYSYNGCVPVLWTIGIELQYYALLPILFVAAWWLARGKRWAVPLILLAVVLGLDPLWQLALRPLVGIVPSKIIASSDSRAVYGSVFYYLKWFGVGMGAAWLVRTDVALLRARFIWDATFVAGSLSLGVLVSKANEGEWRTLSTLGWPLAPTACALLVISAPRARLSHWVLDNPAVRFLGALSYGIYLWHWPLQKAVFGGTLPPRLGASRAFFVCGALAALLTLIVAGLSHVVVEQPAVAWARRQPSLLAALQSILGWLRLKVGANSSEATTPRLKETASVV